MVNHSVLFVQLTTENIKGSDTNCLIMNAFSYIYKMLHCSDDIPASYFTMPTENKRSVYLSL
jgi:hypothetical protein